MYPEIYDSSNVNRLAIMDNITKNNLFWRVNNRFDFAFKAFEKPFKSEYIDFDNRVRADGNTFDIVYIDIDHDLSDEVVYDVKCEHVFYRLSGDAYQLENYAFTGTPSAILTDLLSGSDFSVGDIDYTDPIAFVVNQNATVMQIIIFLANTLGGEIGFSDNGFTIDLKNTIGQDNGYEIRIKKNLKGIKKIRDKRGGDETTYKIDMVNIFKSEGFIDRGLEDLETVGVGDTVRVVDEVINLDIQQGVLEIQKDVIKDINTKIVLTSNFNYLADSINDVFTAAVKTSDIRYGVKLNNDDGLEIERYDKLARSRFNADEWRAQTGDGLGNYTDALYFDILAGKYKFIGDIDATGTITGATIIGGDIIGGTIDIGSGEFEVDSAGNLTATSADIEGTITSSTIIGSDIIGGDVSGARFFGSTGTAYMEIGAGGNLADLTLNRSGSDIFFKIEDDIPGVSFEADASPGDTFTFLTAYDGDTFMQGDWIYNSSEVVSFISAGTGLNGGGDGPTVSLSIDDDYVVTSPSNQEIELQVFGGQLEWRDGGSGSFTALQNA